MPGTLFPAVLSGEPPGTMSCRRLICALFGACLTVLALVLKHPLWPLVMWLDLDKALPIQFEQVHLRWRLHGV